YPGQPHILARFMAIKSAEHLKVARRVAMSWVIIVLAAAIMVGLTAVLALEPLHGPDTEKAFILMSTAYLHPVLAGICLSGILEERVDADMGCELRVCAGYVSTLVTAPVARLSAVVGG